MTQEYLTGYYANIIATNNEKYATKSFVIDRMVAIIL